MNVKRKLNIVVIFGGRSPEHEVSIKSAKNIVNVIDENKYNIFLIYIDKMGKWFVNESLNFEEINDPLFLYFENKGKILKIHNSNFITDLNIDLIFPVLHGPFGEDGSLQGLIKLMNLPFVGAGILGSSVGMDKDIMKRLLKNANIPIADFLVLKDYESIPKFEEIKEKLSVPFFIKPSSMGSSIGIKKIYNELDYKNGVKTAFQFDRKIILEEYIDGDEVECFVLGNDNPRASCLGKIKFSNDFYSYDVKYNADDNVYFEIPAKISSELKTKIQNLAIKTFKVLSCEGMGRVDFFLKDNNEIIVNEINTIPGFTDNSMYNKLWEVSGISNTELIDILIELAIERFNKNNFLYTN